MPTVERISVTKALTPEKYNVWRIGARGERIWLDGAIPLEEAMDRAIEEQAQFPILDVFLDGKLYHENGLSHIPAVNHG